MEKLDPRLHAFRPDLADHSLRGKVEAENFTHAEPAFINVAVASVHKQPDPAAMQLTQALYGEVCQVFERRNGWAWIQLLQDNYVGYVREAALGELVLDELTHRVSNISTWRFAKADLKSQPAAELHLNTAVSVAAIDGYYAVLSGGGAIFKDHLTVINSFDNDFVSVAERFLHTPYLWGGKTRAGIDCSGLVQVSLQASGRKALRDSDMQENSLGKIVDDHSKLQRGDLVFWPGHVGIMQSASQVIHANGYFMKVTSELLSEVISRSDKPISNIRRLSADRHIPAAK